MIAWRETLMAGAMFMPVAVANRTIVKPDLDPDSVIMASQTAVTPKVKVKSTRRERELFGEVSELVKSRYRIGFGLILVDEPFFPPDCRKGQTLAGLCEVGLMPKRIHPKYFPWLTEWVRRYEESQTVPGNPVKDPYFLRRLSYFEQVKRNPDSLWQSVYLKDPSAEVLYKRSALHEVGCAIFDFVIKGNDDLIPNFVDMDVASECWKNDSGKEHPGHPSFYSFFYAACPRSNKLLRQVSVRRTFGDIFALRLMDCIPDVSGDVLLDKKVQAVERMLVSYEVKSKTRKQ